MMQQHPLVLKHGGTENRGFLAYTSFSPDGTFAVTGSYAIPYPSYRLPALAIVWNTVDWTERLRFVGSAQERLGKETSFSPESHLFLFSRRLCDATTGEVIRKIDDVSRLSFSPDGKMLVGLAGDDAPDDYSDGPEEVLLLDSETGEVLQRLTKEKDDRRILGLSFVQGGALIAATSYTYDHSDRVYFWDTKSGAQLATFDPGDLMDLAVAPSGRYVYAIANSREVQLWERKETDDLHNLQWHHRYTRVGHAHGAWDTRFSPDETLLMTVGAEALPHEGDERLAFSVRLWDIRSGREQSMCVFKGKCYALGISPDGRLLATVSSEQDNYFDFKADTYVLTLWDVPSGRMRTRRVMECKQLGLFNHPIGSVIFSPDGRWLVTGHPELVEVWDIPSILSNT